MKLFKLCQNELKEIDRTIDGYKLKRRNARLEESDESNWGMVAKNGKNNSVVMPTTVQKAYDSQEVILRYLSNSLKMSEDADKMIIQEAHNLEFFVELDHENGPLSLNSSLINVVEYVQAGIDKMRNDAKV